MTDEQKAMTMTPTEFQRRILAERDEARRQLESSRRGWQDCIDDLKTTEAERDEARRQLESSRRGWQDCIDDLKTTEAERDEARRQLESSRRGWQDCIDDLKTTEAERDALGGHGERQAEQIKRLRESLLWAKVNLFAGSAHEVGYATLDAVLKETAP